MKALVKKVLRKIASKFPGIVSRVKRAGKGWFLHPLVSGRYEVATSPRSLISAEYVGSSYSRYDTIVRFLAVENYFDKNEYGFDLYEKMQAARGVPEGYVERFRHLIERVSQHGFDWKSALDVTRDGYLLDGSHRLALALYFDVPAVSVRPHYRESGPVSHCLDWFKKNGFSADECALIEERRKKLFWEKGLYFSIILWPPVAGLFDQIQEDIPYEVVKSTDYKYNDLEFEQTVRAIYEIDDIAEWKVDKKLAHMAPYEKRMRVIWVELPDPKYRKKELNNADLSRVGEQLKLSLRKKYKGEVSNYIYDIVCHTGDNWAHNLEMMKVFGTDVSEAGSVRKGS